MPEIPSGIKHPGNLTKGQIQRGGSLKDNSRIFIENNTFQISFGQIYIHIQSRINDLSRAKGDFSCKFFLFRPVCERCTKSGLSLSEQSQATSRRTLTLTIPNQRIGYVVQLLCSAFRLANLTNKQMIVLDFVLLQLFGRNI